MPRISIAIKNAIVYFILLGLTSIFLGYSIFKISSNKIIENATSTLSHNNELVVAQFKTFIDDIQKDILFISKNPFLYEYITHPEDFKLESNLSSEFLALLSTNKQYLQLRLIGIENDGKELIRAEKFSTGSKIIEKSKLQKKGDRDYFIETMELPLDSIYFSEINLNQEYGKINIPIVPTMRIAKTIFHNGKSFGIIIINIDLRYVFDELKEIAGTAYKLTLFNQDGYYLIHPDTSKTFGFEFGRRPVVNLPANFKFTDRKSQYQDKNELYSIIHYTYKRSGYHLFFSLSADKNMLFSVFNQWKSDLLWITLFLTFLSLLIAIWWAQRQSRVFSSLIRSITEFGKNPDTVRLQLNRNDEIGDVFKSFQEMADQINIHLREKELAKTEAEEANRAKQEFLENMSHEIRNPLQSILGITGMLEQNNPRPDQEAFINTLKFSSENLLTLVNDILDYRKLIRGQIELHNKPIRLNYYLDNIIKSHSYEATNKKIRIRLSLEDSLNTKMLYADPVRLSQILHNLLSNAVRYSKPDSEVMLSVYKTNSNLVEFSVSDKGPGLSADNIFNILHQKPVSGASRKLQNVGLGLPIVINLLKLFESNLEIDSGINNGSVFRFALNAKFIQDQPGNNSIQSSHHFLGNYIQNVVCLEDDPQNAFLYKEIFRKLNISIDVFTSPEEMFKQKSTLYDLIITDFNFDYGNLKDHFPGIIKSRQAKGLIFIITAMEDLPEQLNPNDYPYDAYIKKPVSSSELIDMISIHLFKNHFDLPDFSQLFENYDHQNDKIIVALDITITEWKEMYDGIKKAILERNSDLFDKVFHKLINSLRIFKLNAMQVLLEMTRAKLVLENSNPEILIESVTYPFMKYIKIFESEIKKLNHII